MRRIRLLPLLLLTLAPPALASDGVREINQTCAVETGCFAGDAAGFPVTIDASGSYRLTSDLIVPSANDDGIHILASDIGIDLNNFAIIGAGCVGATTDCTPASGSGSGIERQATSYRGTSVKNGSVTGMGGTGVVLGEQAEVTNVRARWNRFDGISASSGSTISGNTLYENGNHGINVGTASTVTANTTIRNGVNGIQSGSMVTVTGNSVYANGQDGIATGNGATVSGNSARDNWNDGIDGGTGCTIVDNAAYSNGDTTGSTGDDGIECDQDCLVRGNTVSFNRGYGLNLSIGSGYRENVVSNNTTGAVVGFGADAGANVIDGVVTVTP